MSDTKRDSFLLYWKSLLACLIVAMCQFQYGLDSTLIGGLQAMPGFLKVMFQRKKKECKACTKLSRRFLDIRIPRHLSGITSQLFANN